MQKHRFATVPAAAGRRVRRKLRGTGLFIFIFIWVSVTAFAPLTVRAADNVPPGTTLTLEQCIAIALEHQPQLLKAKSNLQAALSRVGQVKAGYYPQINAFSAYNRKHTPPASGAGGTGDTYHQYEGAVELNQNLYNFGKTGAQVDQKTRQAEALRHDLQNTSREIVFNVQQAYYRLLQARQRREAIVEEVTQFQLHLDQAQKFYEVGLKARNDVTSAKVNLSQARLNLVGADDTLRSARLALNYAMGEPEAPEYEIAEPPAEEEPALTLAAACQQGYDARPDLKSAAAAREAFERAAAAEKEYYPTLAGKAQYGWLGREFPLEEEWLLGAELSFPLFNGFSTYYQRAEAIANLQAAKADEALIRQATCYEIEEAYHHLNNLREAVSVAELALTEAREHRELVQGRYADGLGGAIEVADAVAGEANAKTAYINARFDYRIAWARLRMAMGVNDK